MNDFVRNLITEWRKLKLPFEDQTFVVAVSGGADSLSLILALNELKERKKLNLRFVIAHFNHDLRGIESEQDEEFVRQIAAKYKLELALLKGKINSKENLEENARIARYNFLTETAQNLNAYGVLTAHTLNDQAETFLINLIRGSGLEGLGGMKSIRHLKNSEFRIQNSVEEYKDSKTKNQKPKTNPLSQIILIRPFLTWAKRQMTEKYCHENNIKYRYDTMNEDEAYKRVRIRKILLPLLKDFNPKIIEGLANTAFLLQEDFDALEQIKKLHLHGFEHLSDDEKSKSLRIEDLKDLFPSMRRSILRDWLKVHRGNLRGLGSKHFEAIESLISSRKSGKVVELPNKSFIKKEDGRITFNENKG